MTMITARDASRGFSAVLDRVERNAEEYTIMRDGRAVARIIPASPGTVAGFLARRTGGPALDDDFAGDAVGAQGLLTIGEENPWRD